MYKLFSTLLIMAVLVAVPAAAGQEATERQTAEASIKQAEAVITDMQQQGFGILYPNDTLNEAKILFSQRFYKGAEALAVKVAEIKIQAEALKRFTDDVESKIVQAEAKGLDVQRSRELFLQGLEAFQREDYSNAEALFVDAFNMADEIESEKALDIARKADPGYIKSLRQNWPFVLVAVAILVFAGNYAYIRLARSMTRRTIKLLEKEQKAVENLMKDLQRKYFQLGEISKSAYTTALEAHHERLNYIKKETINLREKLKG